MLVRFASGVLCGDVVDLCARCSGDACAGVAWAASGTYMFACFVIAAISSPLGRGTVCHIYLMNTYTAQYSGIPALLSPCGYGYCAGHSSRTLLCDCTCINLYQTKSGDVATTLETYICMTQRLFTHATPTRFNAGRRLPHKFFTCITNRPGCYHKWHLRCVEAVLYII